MHLAKILIVIAGVHCTAMTGCSANRVATDEVASKSPTTELLGRGEAIAEGACADCHAIRADDASRHATAPPFRFIGQSYPIESLGEAFAEGIVVGHPDMPVWTFEPEDIDALLTYMESVQVDG
jgi:mono/diheme cytochrome c family protein